MIVQPRRKHIPVRTCIVCKNRDGKRALVRLVRTDAGIQVDPSGKMNGRGAYLCHHKACWERAISTEVLSKALKTTLTDEDLERLHRAMPSP